MNTIKTIVGIKLSELRKKRGYNVKQLSEISGLASSTIRNIESGIDSLSLTKLYYLCDILKCDILNVLPSSEIYIKNKLNK